mmetsp:Transcript_42552/g.126235  ORF Transcript_42552/g.126235 Transcript_42552/m.126235 type:complete len:725 (-) Transcript_42552:96-2270(-)
MIRYDKESRMVALYWWGGLNRHLILPTLSYAVFLTIAWYLRMKKFTEQSNLTPEEELESVEAFGHALGTIVSFVVFLFVFRLNQGMARFTEGSSRMTSLFESLEQCVDLCCAALEGGNLTRGLTTVHPESNNAQMIKGKTEEELWDIHIKRDELARACRVHIVRLTLAFAITFLLHCHQRSSVAEEFGCVDEEKMMYIIYLYSRLKMLLYTEELKAIDDGISVCIESREGEEPLFRTEAGRHQVTGITCGAPIIGSAQEGTRGLIPESAEKGKLVCSPHKTIFMLMQDLINQPVDESWGYTQRQMGPILYQAQHAMNQVAHIDHILAVPVSLAYFQHCRVLLLIFGLFYPFSCDPSTGPVENVLIPCLGLWAIMGLEKLADIMENPFGTDDTDLDSMRHLHTLEVVASRAWQHSETYREGNRQAQIQILRKSTLGTATDLQQEHLTRRKPGFESFFTWKPIPSLIVQESMEKHGHVDIKHRMALDGDMQSSLRRTWRRVVRGRGYQDVAKSFMSCCTDAEWATDFMKMDPNIFAHYLVFNDIFGVDPVTGEECEEARSFNLWRMRCFKLLGQDHEAISLLDVNCPMDSERSVMGPRVWWTRQETGSMGSLASKGMMDTDPLLQDASIMTGGAGPLPGSSLETASTDVSPDPGRLHGAPRKLSPVDLLGALGDQLEGQSVIAGQRNGDMQMQAPPLPAYPVSATSEGGKGIDLALAASGLPTNYC